MNIQINSVHFDADKKLEDFITKKVTKLVEKNDYIIGVDVTLKLDNAQNKENKVTEMKINVKGGDFFSKKQSASFEESTDEVVEALRRQLKKHKEKSTDK
ncbi:MAG: ribosome-associated translation inhibitor RaiA [Bacteroidales bacterium]|nr:ribosome-associated translation inhibitor RaiA [Bacteroidales bacterium]